MLKVVARALLLVAKEFGVIFSALLYVCLPAQVKRVHPQVSRNGPGACLCFFFYCFFIDHLVELLRKARTQLESFMSVAQMMLDELYPKC